MKTGWIMCILVIILTGSVAAQPSTTPKAATLGRLFLTLDTRVQLERQRQFNIREAHSQETGTIRLDGVVIRSSGQTTAWVNQRDTRENGIIVSISPHQPNQASLQTGNDHPAELKVGATFDRATRETFDGLAKGEIRIHRPSRPQP